jgi:hypothetical protein
MIKHAIFSSDRKYRSVLVRKWAPGPTLMFLMLNPSTADEDDNDPTVARCVVRAELGGYGSIAVCNIFAYVSTDPRQLTTLPEQYAIGYDNDSIILETARSSAKVICGWGKWGSLYRRGERVLDLLRGNGIVPHALRINLDGTPAHPLYLPYHLQPLPMFAPTGDLKLTGARR